MLSPVALAAGDFLTWRIRLPDSVQSLVAGKLYNCVRKTKNHCLANGDSSSPPCEKGEKRMEQYTTQMDAARRGIVTKRIRNCSEKRAHDRRRADAACSRGKVAICANKHHTCIDPEGVRINVTHEDQCQSRCVERLQGL